MKIPCPYCGDSIKYDESLGGRTIECGYCRRPVTMPSVAQLPPDYQAEFRREQEKLRKKAEAAEQKRLRAQQKEAEKKRAELVRRESDRLAQEAEWAQRQQYQQAVAVAKADPDKPKVWCCTAKGVQHGPMKEEMVQKWLDDGALGGGDYVLPEGTATWIRVSDLPERFHVPAHDDSVRCPKCGCTQLSSQKRGMSGQDACCGALALGPLGLLCGLEGANKVVITCLKCGHQWSRG